MALGVIQSLLENEASIINYLESVWTGDVFFPLFTYLIIYSYKHTLKDTHTLGYTARVLWTARRSNQSILKEINPEYSLERLTLKLKLQYFGHLLWKANSLEKTLMLGKIEGRRRRGWQRMRWLCSITDSMHMSLSKLWEIVKDKDAWHGAIHGVSKSQTQLSEWTTTTTHCDTTVFLLLKLLHYMLLKIGHGDIFWLVPLYLW